MKAKNFARSACKKVVRDERVKLCEFILSELILAQIRGATAKGVIEYFQQNFSLKEREMIKNELEKMLMIGL